MEHSWLHPGSQWIEVPWRPNSCNLTFLRKISRRVERKSHHTILPLKLLKQTLFRLTCILLYFRFQQRVKKENSPSAKRCLSPREVPTCPQASSGSWSCLRGRRNSRSAGASPLL